MPVSKGKQLKPQLLQPGQSFERYTIERLLGRGGMGEVYLARHSTLGVYHALKLLFPDVASRGATQVERFLREAQLASRIKHPNLIEVHDAGYSEVVAPNGEVVGVYYIFMDYLSGGTLGERLRTHGRMSPEGTLEILRQVADALVAAEANQMVHRDIKPDNIMFTEKDQVKLADLGIAKSTREQDETLTMAASVFGTPAYMSPEQARDASRVDIRADIYSLGCVAYEMLTGHRPYKGKSSMELLSEVVSPQEIPSVREAVPEVPVSIARLVSAMCRKDREKRIQTPRELVLHIEKLQSELSGTKKHSAAVGGLWGKMRALFFRDDGKSLCAPPVLAIPEAVADQRDAESIGLTLETPRDQAPVAESTGLTLETPRVQAPVAESTGLTLETPQVQAPVAESTGLTLETLQGQAPVAESTGLTLETLQGQAPVAESTGLTLETPRPAAREQAGAELKAPAVVSNQAVVQQETGTTHFRRTSLSLAILVVVLAVVFLSYTYLNNRRDRHQPETPSVSTQPPTSLTPPLTDSGEPAVNPADVSQLRELLSLKQKEVMQIPDLEPIIQQFCGDFQHNLKAGDLAEQSGDLSRAYELFQKASADADWLLTNMPLREEAAHAREAAAIVHAAADEPYVEVMKYASNDYQEALENERRGALSFEQGEFAKAAAQWQLAAEQYSKAKKNALDRHQKELENLVTTAESRQEWGKLKAVAQEMKELNPEVAERWMNMAIEGEHGTELSRLREAAKEAWHGKQWNILLDLAMKMEPLNPQEAAQWSSKAEEAEKAERMALLEEAVAARGDGDWAGCLAKAEELLRRVPDHDQAQDLKQEALEELKPRLLVVRAMIDGREGEVKADLRLHGENGPRKSGDEMEVQLGTRYKATLEYHQGEDIYLGKLDYVCQMPGSQRVEVKLNKFDATVTFLDGTRRLKMNRFSMGCPSGELGHSPDGMQRKVTFWLGQSKVTQGQWKAVMGYNPSRDQRSLISAVDNVTWEEARDFCEKLNANPDLLRPSGYRFDLPTEAQWKHAREEDEPDECFLDKPRVPNGVGFHLALVPEE